MPRKGLIGFAALLMTTIPLFLFLASPASAAQYVIHPSGANVSNCASFSNSAATDLDTHNSDTSYAWTSSSACDLYMDLDDPAVPASTINWVSVTAVVRDTSWGTTSSTYQIGVKLGASTSVSGNYTSGDNYATITSPQWTTKPGGGAWTWADINSLVALVDKNQANTVTLRITELYVTVDYVVTLNVTGVSAAPSPFNPSTPASTTISYTLNNTVAANDLVWIRIYDGSGVLKRNLLTPADYTTANKTAGANNSAWDGKDNGAVVVANGTYGYHIDVAGNMAIKTPTAAAVDVAALTSAYDTLYAVSSSNLYKTTDGGTTWTTNGTYNAQGNPVWGVAVSGNGKFIYTAVRGTGVRMSSDYGVTWANKNPGNLNVVDVACDSTGLIVYALVNQNASTKKIYRSTNGGTSWSDITGMSTTGVDWWGVSCTPDGKIVMIIDQTTTPATSSRYFKSVTSGTSWTTSAAIGYGTAVGQLSYPNQISLDAEGGYVIADRGNHRVQKFDSSGAAVMVIGGTTAGVAADTYKFNAGTPAAFGIGLVNYDDHHMLWVADVNNARLKKYSLTDYGSSTDIIVCGTGCTDNDPPTTISDLTTGIVQQTSVELIWTAPYENRSASTGDATLYDIRYSTIPITTENWFTATPAAGLPVPGTGGTGESFAVTGLNPSTTYYFAIRAKDDANNWSDLSNVVSATTEGMLAKAMIVYTANSSPGSLYPKDKRWTGSGWTSEYYLPAVTTTSPRKVVLRTEPGGGNTRIAAIKDQGGNFFVHNWDGLAWSSGLSGIALANNNYRQFDLAFEKTPQPDGTYRAILVYSLSASNTALKYRVWDGTAWGAETALYTPGTVTTGTIYWVRLETKPGTDEIMAVWSDSVSKLGAAVWTGSTNTWTVKAAALSTTLASTTNQCWDVVYESSSKDAMVAWMENAVATPKYFTYIGTTWTGPTAAPTITTATTNYLRLSADPRSTSNQILMGIDDDANNNMKVELWSGTAWNATVLTMTTVYSPNTAGKRGFDLAWEGKSGKAMVAYATGAAATTTLKYKGYYRVWDGVTWGAGNWTAETALPTGALIPVWVQLVGDPGSNEIMCGMTDSATDLNIHRWNGSIWLGRQELTMNASTTTGENFMFSYRTDSQPSVSISDPGDNYSLSGSNYVVTGLASDDYGVYKVELHIERDSVPPTHWTGGQWVATEDWLRADNTLSWHYDWQLPLDNGAYTYTLTARATDNMGQIGPVSTSITGIKVYTIADPLTVYRNAATVDSSTQITANAWFSGDGNGDSSTQFETGPSAAGPWTDRGSLATETPDQQYFLRQKAISGLTAGTTYYIRITHTDPDGVTGTNPEVLGPYTTKTNGTTTRAITANVDDCNQVTVSASFDNDGDNDGTTAFHYSTDGAAWAAAPGCGAVAGASPRTCAVTGLTANTTYFFKATFSDADGVSGLNPITTPNPSPYKTLAACLTRGTTVGALSVDNSNCRQLSVRAAYTGDQDADGSTLVEFKKTADATWSTACAAVTGGSPRTCLITDVFGLVASTSYDVRVTWTDADGVSGSNPQSTTLSTPACGSADVFPPTLTIFRPMDGATVSGNATYPVRIEIAAYDRVALNASTVRIIVDGIENAVTANPNVSGNYYYDWAPATTGYHTIQGKAADTAGNYGYSQTFRVYVNSITVDGSGLFSGDGKLLVRENTSQLCFDCHGGIQTHSSQNLSPKYGNWAIDCRTCHTPHNTANIFLIRPVINTPNSGTKTVDFRNTTGQADFSYATKTTPGNGPCEVCHTKTRNGDDSGRYRNTGTGPGPQADSHFTDQTCTDCHKHTQGFSPVSAGNLSCGSCHPDRWTAMNGLTSEYHMYMQNSDTTPIAGGIGSGNKYPNKSQFGAGDKESEHRRCIMCHADMDVFHYKSNPNTPGVSYNLRVSINVAPDPGDPTTYTNKDFDGTRADGGICFSCHANQQTKNTDKMKNSGTTHTPAWNLDEFKAGTHNYSITTTFKSDNSTFNATCVKCHTDTMIKDYQSSTYRVGAHSGTTRSYLSNINKKATVVETSKNSLEENMCYQCHSMSTDGPDNYNPNGWDGVAVGDGKDGYNQQTMNKKAQRLKFLFSKDSSHPIDGAPPYDSINGLSAAAGRHRVDEGVNDAITPSGVQIANWNPAASRHVECMDCHNPHATNLTPRNMITWRANIYHTTTTNYGSGANGRMSNYQVVEGSFGGQIGGANFGAWGVEPTYAAGTGGVAPTSFTKVQNMNSSNMMYQLCFKCHSIYSYGNTRPQIPWGTSTRTAGAGDGWGGNVTADFSWDPGQESDLSIDFNPYNYGTHPILRRGRNQPAPHLNTMWPFFNGGSRAVGNYSGSSWYTAGGWWYSTNNVLAAPTANGTVNYNAAARTVTIATGSNFPTYYLQPGWKIQFTKKQPTAPTAGTDNTYYYEIKTVDSATQVTLVSGPAANQAGVMYNISAGLGWTFVPPYGPWSTLTCGDCHQSGDLADPVGPHGSDNPWIIREIDLAAKVDNNLDGDMVDAVDFINTQTGVSGDSTGWTVTSTICYSCHRRDIYGATASANANSGEPTLPAGATSYELRYSRSFDGHPPGSATNESNPKHNAFGIWCLNCHGGDSIGGIHGSNRGLGAGGGTSNMGLRLRNGAASTGHTITAGVTYNNTGGSCWTKSGTADSINGCLAGHGGSGYKIAYDYTALD